MTIKSLYIHIPFCEHLCDYCDFTKLQYFCIFAKPYLKSLKNELDSYHIDHQLETIYVGGGTPTALEDNLFLELLKIIQPYTRGVKEYTFEANPESLTLEKLKMMKKYGVNRISLGVETTNDEVLKNINRHHTFLDVQKAIKNAKEVEFNNLNADLILGLPGCDIKQIKKDINNLLSLDIKHISCYSLTVHPHTVFYIKGIEEPQGDTSRKYYDEVNQILTDNGFIHYEISNWSIDNYQSKHNFTYWNNEEYYGVGLGASGYVNGIRYVNTKSINKYLKGEFIDEKEVVDEMSDLEYQIMLNLRTNIGLDLDFINDKFHFDFYKKHQSIIDENIKNGYLFIKDNHLIATYEGMMILDQIILSLI